MAHGPHLGEDHYTWDDYRAWPDDERWEIIGGVAYSLAAAPTTWHQWIQQRLSYQLTRHFKRRECVHFTSPIDVRLSNEDVVQPYPALAEVLVLDGSGYRIVAAYDAHGTLESATLDGLAVDLREVFDYPVDPPGIQLIKEDAAPYGRQ